MKTNCLFWALREWGRKGGYLLIRPSVYYPGPHFLHGTKGPEGQVRVRHFVPSAPRKRILPPVLFDGYIKEDDL